jgi:tetratricopeptide (TPR) repeat protein
MVRIKLATVVITLILGINNIFGQNIETAKNYILAERYDDAKEMLNQIIKNEPNNPGAYFYLGQTIVREYLSDSLSNSLNDVCDQAKAAFEAGLKKDSTYFLNFVGKGIMAQLCNDDTLTANKFFNRALATFPKNKKKLTREHGLVCANIAFGYTLGKAKRLKNVPYYLNRAKEIAPNDFEVQIIAGNIYLDQKDGTNAIANFNKALAINPKSPIPQIKIGDLYLAAKNYNSAKSNYDNAKELDSTYAPVYKSYGELWSIAGKYSLAKENFRKYLALSGNNISAKVSYAISLFKTRDFHEAIEVVKEIQAVDNSRNFLNRIGGYSAFDERNPHYEVANNFLTEFFKNAKPSSIIQKDYLYYGRTLLRLKKDSLTNDKGFQMLNKASELNPTDYSLMSEIAQGYFNLDYYDQSIVAYNKKVQTGTATSTDMIYLGRAYMKVKDYAKAAEIFDKISAADPKNMEALMRAANAYANQDPDSKMGLAKPKYDEVIKLGETDQKKYAKELYEAYKFNGSYYLFAEGQGNINQCEPYYTKMIALDPNNKEWLKTAYSSLAILNTKNKAYIPARNWYNKLLEVDPKNETAPKAIESLTKQINMNKVMNEK